MIIEEKIIANNTTFPCAKKTKRVIIYSCDQCKKIFEGKYQKKYLTDRKFHLCSRSCLGLSRKIDGVACEFQLASRDMEKWRDNVQKTVRERYGVDNISQSEDIKRKKEETTFKNWGVKSPQQHPEISRRTIETHARNGFDHWMSKPEKAFRILLEDKFGKENVKVQQLIERKWSVDFYVINVDTYIQFDGVYWHGLDRPLEQIRTSLKTRDKAIYLKWVKDRELDTYVSKQGLRLIRITDVMYKNDPQICLKMIVEN